MNDLQHTDIPKSSHNRAEIVLAPLLFLSSIITAFALAWVILAPVDFLYSVWHDHGGIKEGIEKYGPKNRYKSGFEQTSREQRLEMFHEINLAIHLSGKGLADISYETQGSQGVQRLLREPEVVHLQDVAHLINTLAWIAGGNFLFLAAIVWYALRSNRSAFAFKRQLFGLGSLVVATIVVLVAFGPSQVFNQLHIWVFPAENQWFFYYQESLMSTMMLAPQLFAWIGGTLAVVAVVFYVLWIVGMNYYIAASESKKQEKR